MSKAENMQAHTVSTDTETCFTNVISISFRDHFCLFFSLSVMDLCVCECGTATKKKSGCLTNKLGCFFFLLTGLLLPCFCEWKNGNTWVDWFVLRAGGTKYDLLKVLSPDNRTRSPQGFSKMSLSGHAENKGFAKQSLFILVISVRYDMRNHPRLLVSLFTLCFIKKKNQ